MAIATRLWRWFLGAACVLLLAGAALQVAGYGAIGAQLPTAGLPAAWAAGLRAVWLGFAVHLAGLAALVVLASVRPASAGRSVLVTCSAVLGADTLLLLALAGIVPSAVLTAVAGLLILAAVFVRPPRGRAGQ